MNACLHDDWDTTTEFHDTWASCVAVCKACGEIRFCEARNTVSASTVTTQIYGTKVTKW